MYMCAPVVSDWDRHGAPAGNWAQASVSQFGFGDRCVAAGPSVAVSEAWPESVLAAEKDLRDWRLFKRFFSALLGKREWLETRKMAGQRWRRELDFNSR